MATNSSNLFARYVWLIDILRTYGHRTFEQINELWQSSGLGYGDPLPLRTFHNHRQAIADIFDIDISCKGKGKDSYYYIEGSDRLSGSSFRNWLLDSLSVVNRIHEFKELENRIAVEHVPSGSRWLMTLTDAMKRSVSIEMQYRSYTNPHSHTFELQPYGLKLYNRRWYLIGYNSRYNATRIYALDRIEEISLTEYRFNIPVDFDLNEYYADYPGIIREVDTPLENVVVRVSGYARNYIADLPLHHSQVKVGSDEQCDTYKYRLHPTYDFITQLLQYAAQTEVVSPQSLRQEMVRHIKRMQEIYKNE